MIREIGDALLVDLADEHGEMRINILTFCQSYLNKVETETGMAYEIGKKKARMIIRMIKHHLPPEELETVGAYIQQHNTRLWMEWMRWE